MTGKRSRGQRSKTRHKLRAPKKELTINKILSKPAIDSTVQININSSFHHGLPHPRFQGITGKVVAYRGEGVEVKIHDGKKEKLIVTHPVHLKVLEVGKK
ncbi:MAG: 50S ribosomal protein L21e [Candidatus Diapherotrites archaeon]|nr:50S ribosomal protein L21e [Candidatus Diapherotrites archaeon]